jgi:hypothetical protein
VRAGYCTRPSCLIIGAQKAGTTALSEYLAGHPLVVAPKKKELRFFAPEYSALWPGHPSHWLAGGPDPVDSSQMRAWYHSQFPLPHRTPARSVAFEATPEYLLVPEAPARIWRYRPEMKLIALVREPADRAYSAWNMYRNFGPYKPHIYAPHREGRSFEAAIDEELKEIEHGAYSLDPAYVARGLYAEQLARYLRFFPRSQLLIVDSLEFRAQTARVLRRAYEFLELPPNEGQQLSPIHVGRYNDPPPADVMERLRHFFRPRTEELYVLTGQNFGWE